MTLAPAGMCPLTERCNKVLGTFNSQGTHCEATPFTYQLQPQVEWACPHTAMRGCALWDNRASSQQAGTSAHRGAVHAEILAGDLDPTPALYQCHLLHRLDSPGLSTALMHLHCFWLQTEHGAALAMQTCPEHLSRAEVTLFGEPQEALRH